MALPVLTVFSALGAQGRGVVSAFLDDAAQLKVHIRALTSNTSSPAAQELAKRPNVSVVQVDLTSLESVESALQGSTYIFANTSFDVTTFTTQGPKATEDLENKHKLNIVHAASKVTTLKHMVMSTLPDAKTASGGKYDIPHFQSKVPSDEYVLSPESGLSDKTTFLRVGMYGSNLLRFPHQPVYSEETDSYTLTYPIRPNVKFAFVGDEATNTGLYVRAILEQPEKSIGRIVVVVADYLSVTDWARAYEKLQAKLGTGRKATTKQVSLQEYEQMYGEPGTEIGLMMAYFDEFAEKSFETVTRGLPLATAKDLGIEHKLRSTEETLLGLEWPDASGNGDSSQKATGFQAPKA